MSEIVPNESALLQGLLSKVLLYRFTRNLDKELNERKISHSQLSGSTGRSGNWFNRTFNELEDMRISTFIKSISAINKIISGNEKFKPVEVRAVLDEELFKVASVSIDLSINNDVGHLLQNDPDIRKFFVDIKFYVDALKTLHDVISDEEIQAYEGIMNRIKAEGN
ncbi:hypothetical protein NDK47_08765 [Brevibacillus ruminantium]|uniref:Uncharacterized protein n=1 Tax=Brevibacillus ruminantium TaxID=2950604 RepID=A0ABY4WND7_9BACL|nr:hypothetical protein [Brevibacillus ruminantium]USG67345.1 hypothetical protein NDK47_08765 [Brevibacillus ruminantium]